MNSDITRWLASDWTHAVAALGVLALGYALAWAAIRASYERVVGRPMPRTRVVLALDILADLAVNVPGAINRLLRSTGRDPLFLPAPLASRPPAAPPGRSGEAGRVTVAALASVTLLWLLVAALAACPRLPPVAGCELGAQRCESDRPEVCSASGRWHRVGDLPCAAVGGACLVAGGRAFCGVAEAAPGDVGLALDGGAR